jgi:hypothetical protein
MVLVSHCICCLVIIAAQLPNQFRLSGTETQADSRACLSPNNKHLNAPTGKK